MKQNKGLLQIGLVIGIASVIAGYFLVKNLGFSSVSAQLSNYWKKQIGKCAIGRLCKAPVVNQKDVDSDKKCRIVGYEGCLIDYNCSGGTNVEKTVRRANCGKQNENVPAPTPSHTPTSTPTSTPTPTPTITPTATPTGTPTPTPNSCNGTCGSNFNCQGGLFCYQGFCRNPACSGDSSCGCASPTPTPVLGVTAPPQLPKTGGDDLSIFAGLLGMMGAGTFLFRKFHLI